MEVNRVPRADKQAANVESKPIAAEVIVSTCLLSFKKKLLCSIFNEQ